MAVMIDRPRSEKCLLMTAFPPFRARPMRFGALPTPRLVMRDFWDEYFWLPENVSWTDMKDTDSIRYPHVSDLRYTIIFGFALLQCFVSISLMSSLTDLADTSGIVRFSPYRLDWWLDLFSFDATLLILLKEPQLKDVSECWRGWPHHNISSAVWWYYIIEASFYWALFIGTLCVDVRRADFVQMMLHHGITIALLYVSWSMNMVRVGTLVLFVHDAADIFIEIAKIVRYANWQTTLNVLFVIFIVVWTATRLVFYPFWIIRSVWFDAPELIQSSYRWTNLWQRPLVPRLLMVMLSSLLVLHIFWTYVILKVAYKSVQGGELDDVREESDSDEDNAAKTKED
ncbi:Longevity-assurance protein [Ancylostoma ceylanicum]|uniref:Longevity-assurance protein n=1 Tax=Ancylostoma ceylanicum TaxID=53326 RepID=A0A0D6LFS0_9BILA|nr:Longevity-assurance protein [Ancylostoma ceylanicum]